MSLGLKNKRAWRLEVEKNHDSWYGLAVVYAAASIMDSLAEGQMLEEAFDRCKGLGLSGQQVDFVMNTVWRNSTRGEEFLKWYQINH